MHQSVVGKAELTTLYSIWHSALYHRTINLKCEVSVNSLCWAARVPFMWVYENICGHLSSIFYLWSLINLQTSWKILTSSFHAAQICSNWLGAISKFQQSNTAQNSPEPLHKRLWYNHENHIVSSLSVTPLQSQLCLDMIVGGCAHTIMIPGSYKV